MSAMPDAYLRHVGPGATIGRCPANPRSQTPASSSPFPPSCCVKSTTTAGKTASTPAPKPSASWSKKASKPLKSRLRLLSRLPPIPCRPTYPSLNPRLPLNQPRTTRRLSLHPAASPPGIRAIVIKPALPALGRQIPALLPPIVLMPQIPPLILGIDPVRPPPRALKILPHQPHPIRPQPHNTIFNHPSLTIVSEFSLTSLKAPCLTRSVSRLGLTILTHGACSLGMRGAIGGDPPSGGPPQRWVL
jgi:hypothetical protein